MIAIFFMIANLTWFLGPYEGGLDSGHYEFAGCEQSFQLEGDASSRQFAKNLAVRPVLVFVTGSAFAGMEMRIHRGRVCVSSYNRLTEGQYLVGGRPGIEPSLPQLVQWSLAVFQRHSVKPKPPATLANDAEPTSWAKDLAHFQKIYPQEYDPAILKNVLEQSQIPVPSELLTEIRNWPTRKPTSSPSESGGR